MRKPKFIFVTGGVVSSLGKGIASSAIGALMESRGLNITIMKLDPYINVDPGTMNPLQHGEVFVTDDGAETDLDLGHYERFTTAHMGRKNNYTSGQIYDRVISKERRGEYLGGTVQVIPHITDEIKSVIKDAAQGYDLAIIEIGGTVGDIESLPFLEACRQFRIDLGPENICYIHLTLVPYMKAAGELKSKPTQHSVGKLREIGIQPDILICRCDRDLPTELKDKIALFCNTPKNRVITAVDVDTIYEVPLKLHKEGLDEEVLKILNIWTGAPKLEKWEELVRKVKEPSADVEIAIVGKYVMLIESYKSLYEALVHAGIENNIRIRQRYVDSEDIEKQGAEELLAGTDGILVPGGFGDRGTLGKIEAVRYARENKIPFFGICLGMQMAVVEFARNVLKMKNANSHEFDENCADPVIHLMDEQKDVIDKGGTMRLGAYPCVIKSGSQAEKAYGVTEISERHRHRFEFNNWYRNAFEEKGLVLSGLSPDGKLVEIIELTDHPWFIGCQFHPEFKSRPTVAHPLYRDFISAAKKVSVSEKGSSRSEQVESAPAREAT